MTFSGTTWIIIGISQFTFVFAISAVFLFLYNRQLKKRAHSLNERMNAQSQLHRKAIQTLKDKLKEEQASPPSAAQTETVEVPGGEFSALLNRNIQQTEERLIALGAEPNAEFQADDSAEIIAARMRHALLESEKLVLAFSTDPELMWETLQPNIDKIAIGLRRHNAMIMGHNDPLTQDKSDQNNDAASQSSEEDTQSAALKEKLETLENRWRSLETQAENCLGVLDESYNTLTLALANQAADNQVHKQTDALTNRFLHILNDITASDYPDKDFQQHLSSAETSTPTSDADANTEAEHAAPTSGDDLVFDDLDDDLDEGIEGDGGDTSGLEAAEDDTSPQNDITAETQTAEASAETPTPDTHTQEEAELDALADELADQGAKETTEQTSDTTPETTPEAQNLDDIAFDSDEPDDDDVDAAMAETEAFTDNDVGSDSDGDASAQESRQPSAEPQSTITDRQIDALDEEFEALTNPPLYEDDDTPVDPLAALDDEGEHDDAGDSAQMPEPDGSETEATDEAPHETDDDELDPDAIIAEALAATEDDENDDADDPMDNATFEDLLADSGVDLHNDLNAK